MAAQSPAELSVLFQEAINEGSLAALLDLYESDAAFAEGPQGSVGHGAEALRAHLAGLVAMAPTFDEVVPLKVFEAGDIALVCSTWSATATTPDGERLNMSGRGTEVSRRQADGTWRLVVDNPWGTE